MLLFGIVSYNDTLDNIELEVAPISRQVAEISTANQLERFILNHTNNVVQITVISSDHRVMFDTNPVELRKIDLNYLNFWNEITENKPHVRISAPYTNVTVRMLEYYVRINSNVDPSGHLYLRFSTKIFLTSQPFWLLIILEIFAIVIIVLMIIYIFRVNIKRSLRPLMNVKTLLNEINTKTEFNNNIDLVKTDDPEIDSVFEQIVDIGSKIYSSMSNLKMEQEKSKALLSSISQGIVGINDNGNVITYNEQALNILGFKDDITGINFIYNLNDETLIEKLKKAVEKHVNSNFDYIVKDKVYRVEVVFDEGYLDFNFGYYLVVFTDITIEYNDAVMKNEFFALASHELKTPLTAINGYSEFLSSDEPTPKQIAKCSSEINKNAQKMKILIDEMLIMSKLEAFKQNKENLVELSVGDISAAVVNELSVIADKNNIKLVINGDARFKSDPNQVKLAIKNLVSNAIKYNKKDGYVDINIKDEDSYVEISVSDQGIGIPKESIPKIFDRFYKADNSIKALIQESSTGLGLAITKKSVELCNGEISVNSEENVGTTFTIRYNKK